MDKKYTCYTWHCGEEGGIDAALTSDFEDDDFVDSSCCVASMGTFNTQSELKDILLNFDPEWFSDEEASDTAAEMWSDLVCTDTEE